MSVAKPVLDFKKLTEFLLSLLQTTDDVKKLLNSQCDEAKFVLTPWPLETVTRKPVDRESCTCARRVSEIASGIDKAIAQARQLREKLALNVLEEKKLARRPSVKQIYAPSFKETNSKTKLATDFKIGKENSAADKSSGEKDRGNVMRRQGIGEKKGFSLDKQDPSLKRNSCMNIEKGDGNTKSGNSAGRARSSERDKKSLGETRRGLSNVRNVAEAKRVADKKLVATSPYNSLAAASGAERKSKGKKNFIAANKWSVKNVRGANFLASDSGCLKKDTSKKSIHNSESSTTTKSYDSQISGVNSAAEIDKLISKLSTESVKNKPTNSDGNFEGKGCSVHDLGAPKFVEEKIYTSVDVAEGLDRFGVPAELVKVLKVYHGYLNRRSMPDVRNKKGEKAANRFLNEFQSMNRVREKSSSSSRRENELNDLFKNFLPLFKESCNKNVDFVELSRLKIRYMDLDSACKSLDIRNVTPNKRKISNMIENRRNKNFLEVIKSWKSNAVWNEACIPSFWGLKGMSNALSIRYSNRNQLLALFGLMQRVQQSKYRGSLVDFLISEAVPWVNNNFDPTSEDYVNAYKMISIISNLPNSRVPVLVRTDK